MASPHGPPVPGWYDDPQHPGFPRWWDGYRWAAPTPGVGWSGHGGHGQAPGRPPDLEEEAATGQRARAALWAGAAAYCIQFVANAIYFAASIDLIKESMTPGSSRAD